MSIDLYPRLDLQERGAIPADASPGVGAASLFHRNDDGVWPDFAGRDLVTGDPSIRKADLCVDGATIGHTLDQQMPRVTADVRAAARVVTVTAGGNDLLGGVLDGVAGMRAETERAIRRYRELVELVLEAFASAQVILTTVYDPTDGSGVLPGLSEQLGPLPLGLLDRFNDEVRRLAGASSRAHLADVHRHFLGHGLSAPVEECWYWPTSPIEPGGRGASEIRRLWLDAASTPPR